MSRVYN